MSSPKKRINANEVLEKLWKAANFPSQDPKKISLTNLSRPKPHSPPLLPQHPSLSVASLTQKGHFSFSLLNIHPTSKAPLVIKRQDALVSRGLLPAPVDPFQPSCQNLSVESPIVSDLFKFKKRIVSSKQIEKKIENNEYLLMILGRKNTKNGKNASFSKETTVKQRLQSALLRQSNWSAANPKGPGGLPLEICSKGDKAEKRERVPWERRDVSEMPAFGFNMEISNCGQSRDPKSQNVNNLNDNRISEAHSENEKFKIKIKFNRTFSTVSQTKNAKPLTEEIKNAPTRKLVQKSQIFLAGHDPLSQLHKNNPNAKRPFTSFANSHKNPKVHFSPSQNAAPTRLARPLSSISPMPEMPEKAFSAISKKLPGDSALSAPGDLCPIFDFSEPTAFVSTIFKNRAEYTRPSRRIGLFVQFAESLRLEHLESVSSAKRGTQVGRKARSQIPIQFSLVQLFSGEGESQEEGICYFLEFEKMLELPCYCIFPEFVSREMMAREGIPCPKVAPMEENERRFRNREAYFLRVLAKMGGTYDPGILIDDFYAKRGRKAKDLALADIASVQISNENSLERYFLYCDEKFIPKSKISPFDKKWVLGILRNFPEKMLKDNEAKFRDFFNQIFEDYVAIQRKTILEYLLRSAEERKRLGIAHLPGNYEISSNEIIAKSGGYHKKLYKSWNDTFVNCGKILNREEKLLNIKSLAFKNWLSEFQGISLFEEHLLFQTIERDILTNIHGFVKFQIAFLGMFQIFGEIFLKRGIITLIDGDFYLKPSTFDLFGQFHFSGFSSLTPKTKPCNSLSSFSSSKAIEEILATSLNKDFANLVDLFAKLLKKQKSEIAQNFQMKLHQNQKSLALNFKGRPCDPKRAIQGLNSDKRDSGSDRLIPVMCSIMEDFIVERTISGFEGFHRLVNEKSREAAGNVREPIFQPFITLDLRFEEGNFCFDDSWENIKVLVELYFERLFSAFDFIYDIFDFTIFVGPNEQEQAKKRLKRSPMAAEGGNSEISEFLKEVRAIYGDYMPEISLELKSSEEEAVLFDTENVPPENRSKFLNKEKILSRVQNETTDLRAKILQILEDQYKEALKTANDFLKFQPILTRSFEQTEFPEFMRNHKSHILAFSALVVQKNKDRHASQMSHLTEKLNNEEILTLKSKLIALTSDLESLSPIRHFPIFKVRRTSVISSLRTYLAETEERLCRRVVERVILNVKSFLGRYHRLTDLLRKEIASSSDYAWLRKFSLEAGQERQILLRRAREIFENFDAFLRAKSARAGGTEVLELLLELAGADRALGAEIDNSLERGLARKVEFERRLREAKAEFQAECAELLDEAQILRTISDVRSSGQYFEEVAHLARKLEKLKGDFKAIDCGEKDIYERNFKTGLFLELDDLVLTNLEVWKMVSQGLAFIKRTNLVHVCQLKIAPIEDFIAETEANYSRMVANPEISAKENLRVILADFRREFDDFAANLEALRLICTEELRPDHWQSYFASLSADLDFQFLNLKIFLSLYNDVNKGGFQDLCRRAVEERRVRVRLDAEGKLFGEIALKIADGENEVCIENFEEVLGAVSRVKVGLSDLEVQPFTDFAREDINELGGWLDKIWRLLPLVGKMQEKLENFKGIFAQVEFSNEIEKAHCEFLLVLSFNRNLKALMSCQGLKAIITNQDFELELNMNMSRLEIIENHHKESILSHLIDS